MEVVSSGFTQAFNPLIPEAPLPANHYRTINSLGTGRLLLAEPGDAMENYSRLPRFTQWSCGPINYAVEFLLLLAAFRESADGAAHM